MNENKNVALLLLQWLIWIHIQACIPTHIESI